MLVAMLTLALGVGLCFVGFVLLGCYLLWYFGIMPIPRDEERGTSLALLVLGTLATTATAIYEDQVGSFDWHQERLGRVTHATFAGSKANKRAFVATEQGAIGSLDFNTGDIGASSERTRPDRIGQPDTTRYSTRATIGPPPEK